MSGYNNIRYWIKCGLSLLVFGGGLVFSWIYFAPLSSAAIAPGQVIVEGYRKKIQHLDGGIIEKIYVKDGQLVSVGDPLVTLNSTTAKTRFLQIKSRYYNALSKYNRLQSEISESATISFLDSLDTSDPLIAQAIATQTKLKQIRLEALNGSIQIANQKVEQAKQNLNSYIARSRIDQQAASLLDEQVSMLAKLSKKGFASREQLLFSQRERLDIQRRIDDYDAVMAREELVIAEAKQNIANLRLEFIKEASEELELAERDIIELKEHLSQAREELARSTIISPINGKIVELNVHTLGGIVTSGEVLMEVIPVDSNLIVEASVAPADIDTVQLGQLAEVRLTSYNYRRLLPITGKVVFISADSIVDEKSEQSSYTINIELDMNTVERNSHIKLYPGMPAEVLIILDERTVVDYLLNPLLISLNKAFRDSDL
ncbi:HlyD family type I secretion periplasmic adaptor subunit [Vibrio amylolyticus]